MIFNIFLEGIFFIVIVGPALDYGGGACIFLFFLNEKHREVVTYRYIQCPGGNNIIHIGKDQVKT